MYTLRYNMLMIIALFFALGLGIILGILIGSPLIQKQEQQLIHQVHQRYVHTLQEAKASALAIATQQRKQEEEERRIRQGVIAFFQPFFQDKRIYVSPMVGKEAYQLLQQLGAQVEGISWSQLESGSLQRGVLLFSPSEMFSSSLLHERFTSRSLGFSPLLLPAPVSLEAWLNWVHQLYYQLNAVEGG